MTAADTEILVELAEKLESAAEDITQAARQLRSMYTEAKRLEGLSDGGVGATGAPKGYREPGDNYVLKADHAIAELAGTSKPARNDKLNIVALTLARLPIDREALRLKLVEACEANGLIADDGLRAVEATIRSAFGAADREGMWPQ